MVRTAHFHPSIRHSTNPFPSPQAHRIITQVLASGSRIFGRAVTEAYKQAQASQKYAASAAGKGPGASRTHEASGLTLDEACKILDTAPPKDGKTNMEKVVERFQRLFDANDPKKGGSFYLQSKILRARQRIEMEVRGREEAASKAKEQREGWKPKVYKD
jgi:mitochondrial import inner membrane translocase subunit TIM16